MEIRPLQKREDENQGNPNIFSLFTTVYLVACFGGKFLYLLIPI